MVARPPGAAAARHAAPAGEARPHGGQLDMRSYSCICPVRTFVVCVLLAILQVLTVDVVELWVLLNPKLTSDSSNEQELQNVLRLVMLSYYYIWLPSTVLSTDVI